MRRNKPINIRVVMLTIFVFVIVASVSSSQHVEFPSDCPQEEVMMEEETERYESVAVGLKANTKIRVSSVCLHDEQKRMVNVDAIARFCQPDLFSTSQSADKCHLYCIYRL